MAGRTISLAWSAFALLVLLAGPTLAREPASYSPPPPPGASQQGMLEMLSEMELLKREVQQLRGEVELQSHTLEQMRRQQRQQYLDVDGRLNQLQSGTTPGRSLSDAHVPDRQPILAPPVREPLQAPSMQPPPQTLSPAPVSVPTPAPVAGNAGDKAAYNEAFGLLKDGQYGPAAEAFRGFIATYPASSYTDNAQYWLAETYYKTRQHKQALNEFKSVLKSFPGSPKALDARLKIGYIHYELQDWVSARQELEKVVRLSPNSTAARLAQNRLKRMRNEGH